GREHALAWKLSQSPLLGELHAAPGNPGIASHATLHPIAASDLEGLTALAARLAADLVVVGPEAPLVDGLADRLADAGIPVFGPTAAAARLEGSKAFAKSVMAAAGVPTAAFTVCDTPAAAQAAIAEAQGDGVIDADGERLAEIVATVHRPVVNELARRGTPFRGCLYAGMMLTDDGPRVVEFNARFGDPEAQVVLPRLAGDLLELLRRSADGGLAD